jgi:hypothetical protein
MKQEEERKSPVSWGVITSQFAFLDVRAEIRSTASIAIPDRTGARESAVGFGRESVFPWWWFRFGDVLSICFYVETRGGFQNRRLSLPVAGSGGCIRSWGAS